MRKILLFIMVFLFGGNFLWGQVATNSGSGLAASYGSLAAAVTALNGATITSPVVITLTGNETAPIGGYNITAIGTATNTITIQGSSSTITAFTPQTSGALNDAIFKIVGGDYITIQNFTMQENASNTTTTAGTNNMTEWGVALLHASTTNGAQNNIIQNNTISLNKTYTNTFGIYSNNRHSATVIGTTEDITNSTTAPNSNNKVYGNAISNVNMGITFIGCSAAANQDIGNDIGGGSLATGNTITNWGGAAAASGFISNSGTSYCIFVNHQVGENISYNTITSATISGTSVALRGIFKDYSGTAPTGTFTSTISNNTVTITDNFTSGTLECIRSQGMTALSTATISINNNTILNTSMGGTSSSTTIVCIVNSSAPGTLNINNNIIRGTTSTAITGGFTGISNTGAVVTAINMNNNQIGNASGNAITFSAATGTAISCITNSNGAATCALSITGNDIRGITHSVAGSSAHTYIINSAATLSQNISSNTFTNLNVNTTGSVTFVSNAISLTATGTMNINTNSIVTAFNKGGAGGTVTFFSSNASSATGSVVNMTNNNFSNITLTGATSFVGLNNTDGGSPTKTITGNTFNSISGGTNTINPMTVNFFGGTSSVSTNTITNISWGAAVTALTIGGSSSATTLNISGNIINNISTTAGSVVGITNSSPSTTTNISNNTINTLSSTDVVAVNGIVSSASSNIFKNKIYDLSGSNTGSTINGILVSAGATINISNNLIGDLRASIANATNPIIGINLTSTTTTSNINIYHNTIFLNTTSSGVNFGTSGIFHTTNGTATTATLNLRNNIIVNTSTPSGSGVTAAYRRSSATLTNFGATSNNNLFFAGTPSASRLIFTDGTNSDQTLAAYQTRVSTRDAASVSELPTWQSIAGANANFLKYSTAVASLADNTAGTGTGIADDFGGTSRSGTTPDMGAWELTVILPSFTVADNGTQPSAGNINQGSTNNILQSFTITEGGNNTANLTQVTVPLAGNYVASTDIQTTGLKLWANTSSTFGTATALSSKTGASVGAGETVTFNGLTYNIPQSGVRYFWVTADIQPAAVANNTINANALTTANFTFVGGLKSGSVTAGGAQTIQVVVPTISLASGVAPVNNPTQSTTNVVLYRVDVTVATTTAVLNAIQFTTAGTYTASDVLNYKIWYHTNSTFTTGTPTQIGSIAASGTGLKTFTSLTQNFPIGTNYIFLTTDLPCASVVNNTISVNAIVNTDATFASGTFGANTAAGSGTVTINAITLNNATAVTATAGNTQVSLAWTAPTGCVSEIMIVAAPATNSGTPTGDGTAYTANLAYGSGTALGNGFVVYKGSTSPQVITGLTNYTTYYFKVFTRNGTGWSNGVEVSAMPQPVYCATSYTSGCSSDFINNVTFNTLSNLSTGCTGNVGNGYRTVYPASGSTTTSVEQGTTYTLTLRPSSGFSEGFGAWIDYNKDGDFLDTGEFIAVSIGTTNGTDQNFSITIPMSALLGNTTMRVRSFYNTTSILQSHACGAGPSGYGEAEDYIVNIIAASPQTLGTIASVQATPANVNKNTTNNPILRIDLPTSGALGTLTLNNLVVTSGNVNDADIATNGVKLYYTTTTTFSTANPVGTGQSFSSGTATFSSLSRLLTTGNNYIWVAYDVASTATVGNTLDVQVSMGNMTIVEAGGANATSSIPVSALNPAGSVLIIPRNPQALTATAFSNSQINLSTSVNADSDNIMVAWNSTNTFGTPTGTYVSGNSIAGGGTVWYVGTVAGLINHTSLTANTQYFYSVWTVGGSAYSTAAQTTNATTLPNPLNYVFSQSNGTYTEITPTTILFSGTLDDGLSGSQTIPSFIYNGVAYTNMFVSANGFLKLGGASGPSGSNYTPLSTVSTAYQNIISAFGQNLNHNGSGTATVGWSTVGNEVIVQWKNVRRSGITGETVNFQIRLNTVTGDINIVYGSFTSGTSANTMQVGLRGFDETWRTQVSNRQGNLEWDKTTMGTNNTSALSMTTTNLPASGLTYTYTPNTCTPFPIIGVVTQSGANVTVNWTAQAEALDGYDVRYRLQSATIGTYTIVNVVGQASNSTIISGLPTGTYVFEVRSRCSGSTFSDYSNAVVFTIIGNYYLKASGVITTLTDWGTNTDGTGTNPATLTETSVAWNIRNNANISNPAAWTLGAGSKIMVGDGTTATNFILPVGSNVTGTIDVANLGTLTLRNTTNPTLGTLSVGSTVDYNGTGAQTIAVANYSNLTLSGTRIASPVITLASGIIDIGANFSVTATGVGSYTNTGNTVNFSSASMQTIPAFNYLNITNTGNGNRTLAPSGVVNIANIFSPGTGTYTVTGSTVNYSSPSGGPYTMTSFNYNNLIFSGTQTFSIGSGNTINVAGDMSVSAGIFNVSNATGVGILNVVGNFNLSNTGVFNVISSSTATNTIVTVNGNTTISNTAILNLESVSSVSGVAVFATLGDFIGTATGTGSSGMVNFGTGTVAGNEFRIGGNFSKSGAGTFYTSATSIANGFVFNKAGTQTFSYTGANSDYVSYVVSSGSTLQLTSGLVLSSSGSPISTLTVNNGGILDMGSNVISTSSATNPIFTLASGATIKTANTSGLAGSLTGFGASKLVLSSGANYEFNASAAQNMSAFTTTPTANTVNNLTINNNTPTSSTGVTMNGNLTIAGVLNLTQGKLTTGANTLTLQPGAGAVSPALGKANSYVVGNVSISSNTDVQTLLYPMGAGTWWGPARLVTNGGTANATNFTARYFNTASSLNALALPTTPEVIATALHAYWDINKVSGGRNADVQLYWNGNLGQITDRTKLRVLHGAAAWENYGVDNTNGNASDGSAASNMQGSIIKNAVAVFSPFTIGSTDPINPLPITLLSFTGNRANDSYVLLKWTTATETNNRGFDIEVSQNGQNFEKIGFVDGAGNSNSIKNYSMSVANEIGGYFRLKQIDFNDTFSYSNIIFIEGTKTDLIVYPNPTRGEIKLRLDSRQTIIEYSLIDAKGNIFVTEKVNELNKIEQKVSDYLQNLPNSLYILQIKTDKKVYMQKIIKE